MVAIDVTTGQVLWDTKLPPSPYGDATVTNDLVFTTLYNGNVVAYSMQTGKLVFQARIPNGVGTFPPLSIDGSTLVTGRFIYRLGAKASSASPSTGSSGSTKSTSDTSTGPAAKHPAKERPARRRGRAPRVAQR